MMYLNVEDFSSEDFLLAFKSDRPGDQDDAIDYLKPSVEAWLSNFQDPRLKADVVNDATEVWTQTYRQFMDAEPPGGLVADFRESIGESLSQTSTPDNPPSDAQIERVAVWLAVNAINSGTLYGFAASGGNAMRWVTMHDSAVRDTHRVADGQVRPIGSTFDIGGFELRFPGDPVGPPSIWINCRCILAPAGRRGRVASAIDTIEDPDEVLPEDFDIDAEELVDDPVVEIPVHGVATIEGKATGDKRMFTRNALTSRDLPLPIRYEFVGTHGGDTSMVAPVGRIDELWRVEGEEYNEYRFRGVIITTKEYANAALEGIADGSLTGVSVEVDDVVFDPDHEAAKFEAIQKAMETGEMPDPSLDLNVFSEARVCGFTIVPIPAYQEGYIALGEAFEDELSEEDRAALAACACGEPVDDFRDVSTDERKKLAAEGKAMPDGSFPIANVEDLKNAIQAIGRAKDPEATKAFIKKRARALGAEDLIPENWAAETQMMEVITYATSGGTTTFGGNYRVTVTAGGGAGGGAYAPGTKDGPGWITHPRATARIRRYWVHGKGAAKIRWGVPGDFNRCRRQLAKYVQNPDWLAGLCANMHKEAIGVWPGQEAPGGRHALMASGAAPAPLFTLTAAAPARVRPEYFVDPQLPGPTPLRVDLETGRVYGHLATWNVCHIGIPGTCTTAPHSTSDYAYFRTAALIDDDGKEIPVGHITLATGHAPIKATAQAAAAHYDNTGTVVADIAAGEDQYGIWVAGALRAGVDEDLARTLAASRLSGDWRTIRGNLELVGALAVNVPGFPIPRTAIAASAGEQTSLVAAGILEENLEPIVAAALTAEEIAAISRNAVAEYRHQEKREQRLAALKPIRDEVRKDRIKAARLMVPEEN